MIYKAVVIAQARRAASSSLLEHVRLGVGVSRRDARWGACDLVSLFLLDMVPKEISKNEIGG